jgi:hypothetical protein
MNCFNIRELQGILKRKFFTDLVNTSDSHKLSEPTLINMRHKSNMSTILLYDQSLFYNFDLTNTSKSKNFTFNPGKVYTYLSFTNNTNVTNYSTFQLSVINYYLILSSVLKNFLSFLYLPGLPFSITTILNVPYYLPSIFTNPLYLNMFNFNLSMLKNLLNLNITKEVTSSKDSTTYNTSNLNYLTLNNLYPSSFAENSSSWRFNRYSYPLISYDYKNGNYLSIWDQLYPSLSLSFIEVARGIRKAPWFFSDQYTDLLKNNYNTFFNKIYNTVKFEISWHR